MEWEDLPLEIQSKILSCVPLEYAVLSCKLVSKTWKTLLSHRKLKGGLLFAIEIHGNPKLRFGYYDQVLSLPWADDSVEEDYAKCFFKKLTKIIKLPHVYKDAYFRTLASNIVGSCNGLICLSVRTDGSTFCVLNPLTGEYFNLPSTIREERFRIVSGFGYDPCNNNYKIVSIQCPAPRYGGLKYKGSVHVYTLGGIGSGAGWRNVGEIDQEGEGISRSECVLWNGSLHWLDQYQLKKIVAFDLADEKFRFLPVVNQLNYYQSQLKLLGGYLSIVGRGSERINIWSFKNEHSNDMVVEMGYQSWNWCLEFSISTFPSPREDDYYGYFDRYEVFAITKSNEVLLWHTTHAAETIHPILLCRYDPKTDTLSKVLSLETSGLVNIFQGIPHVHSLVSLKALGVDSKTTTEVAANVQFTKEEVKQLYYTPCKRRLLH